MSTPRRQPSNEDSAIPGRASSGIVAAISSLRGRLRPGHLAATLEIGALAVVMHVVFRYVITDTDLKIPADPIATATAEFIVDRVALVDGQVGPSRIVQPSTFADSVDVKGDLDA